jgi:hypothetical protein
VEVEFADPRRIPLQRVKTRALRDAVSAERQKH